ncbi:MAG: SPOR domain-containing protein [Pseudomonadota bacterium]
MPLPSFLQRFRAAAGVKRGASAAPAADEDEVRARARRRLIGASLLVAAAVIGFPLLFDSQPRSLPGDVQVQVVPSAPSARPGTAGLPARGSGGTVGRAPVAQAPVAEVSAADAPTPTRPRGEDAVPALPRAQATDREPPAAASRAAPSGEGLVESAADDARRVEARREEQRRADEQRRAEEQRRAQARATEASRAKALLEGRPAASTPAATGRFVVQIGAFADPASLRDARSRVEKLGLKTYTQAIGEGASRRTRVRVGPFADRAEAERAAARLRQAGMPAAILTL